MNSIFKRIKNRFSKNLWNRKNRNFKVKKCNNGHLLKTLFSIGKTSKGVANIFLYGDNREKISIGEFCSFAECTIIGSGMHIYSTLSTGILNSTRQRKEACKGPVVICDDVWVGYGAIILSGVTIGQGAIIGAGAVVTKDVEPYSIVVGSPARPIKYRFSQTIIKKLLTIDFGRLANQKLPDVVFEDITDDNIDTIVSMLPTKSKEIR